MASIEFRPFAWRSAFVALATLATLATLTAPLAAASQPGAEATPVTNLNAPDVAFFVDPEARARRQAEEWRDSRPEDADLLMRIADTAQADWFGDWTPDPYTAISDRVSRVVGSGALPVLALYNIPFRDCGLYSAGGANDPDHYRAWIVNAARGIGDRPAVVVLEPDALSATDCLPPGQTSERFELLAFAVDTLEAQPLTDVYIDAGNAGWLPPDETARRLAQSGVDHAAGFALNVSNFHATDPSILHGAAISDALGIDGGTRFVIDTGRNGNGAWQSDDPETWCNPPGRALGERPTVETAHPLVDAYLWIKSPGESDGECRGAPPAGEWYPDYALELARNAEWE